MTLITEPNLDPELVRAALPADWPAPEALGFGQHLGPYLITADHDGSGWSAARILRRDDARLAIASGGLQYGLSVFEGMKAYRAPDGGIHLFRPQMHLRRLQASAARLHLPPVDEALFLRSCMLAVRVHEAMLPPAGRGALYLRPTIHADEEALGLKQAARHRYSVTVTPGSDPQLKSLRMWAEDELIRAAPGGLGAAKTGANYAAGLSGLLRARERGYDDVIWLDAATHRWLGEAGTMNLFVQIGGRLLTPPLDGTILAGVTRDSLLQLARKEGLEVAEQGIGLGQLRTAATSGTLGCAFGCGTASRIVRIQGVGSVHGEIAIPDNGLPERLSERLKAVQEGTAKEHADWRVAC
ncbi:branched-chain-amino-acid transaminase [Solimonas sp. K1W22B-7]|uniref:branched-chain-amino-acid transaminase n=1 Tax=Solimonas sp. K1W22B-7 TaxID=2303331 RepID=UPI000E334FFE|nr:branched-chain-amino-acid transaminase [Solimonas sp. K1W22B-7]AXQ28927.1 branched-chain-amino-acid transaminase [Solimonas sp. K1W22B-7]